jgi:hypothetical protein
MFKQDCAGFEGWHIFGEKGASVQAAQVLGCKAWHIFGEKWASMQAVDPA